MLLREPAVAIPTTTIGAYPKPDFLHLPDWFGAAGGPATRRPTEGYEEALAAFGEDAEDLFARAAEQVVADQVEAGIDVPTDGEVRRENYIHYHCRHLDGFDFERLTEKPVRGGNYVSELPTITGPVRARAPFLPHDWRVAQAFTDRPVKVTLPGPMTICDTVADAYYGDVRALGAALAEALNSEVRALAAAGCRWIQVDEPVFARKPTEALAHGIENVERCFHGVGEDVKRVVHICCGYTDQLDAVDYPKADRGAYLALSGALDEAAFDALSLEDAHRHNDLALFERFARKTLIVGFVAVARSRVETIDEVRERLSTVLGHIEPARLMAAPDCGLGLLPRAAARAKLANLVAACGR